MTTLQETQKKLEDLKEKMLHDGREKKLKKDQNDVKKWTSKILLLEREIRGLREKRDETAAAEEEKKEQARLAAEKKAADAHVPPTLLLLLLLLLPSYSTTCSELCCRRTDRGPTRS